jgi:hypothetical protein
MSFQPHGKSCSNIGRMFVLVVPAVRLFANYAEFQRIMLDKRLPCLLLRHLTPKQAGSHTLTVCSWCTAVPMPAAAPPHTLSTLVHFSAQPEPVWSLAPPSQPAYPLQYPPQKVLTLS